MPDPRFPMVEAIFALGFPMLRANRKLVASGTEFRMNHKMHGFSGAVFHVLHGGAQEKALNSEKSVRRRTFLTAKMLICDIFSLRAKEKPRACGALMRWGSFTITRVSAVGY